MRLRLSEGRKTEGGSFRRRHHTPAFLSFFQQEISRGQMDSPGKEFYRTGGQKEVLISLYGHSESHLFSLFGASLRQANQSRPMATECVYRPETLSVFLAAAGLCLLTSPISVGGALNDVRVHRNIVLATKLAISLSRLGLGGEDRLLHVRFPLCISRCEWEELQGDAPRKRVPLSSLAYMVYIRTNDLTTLSFFLSA